MSTSLWSRSLQASTSYSPSLYRVVPSRRCLHASASVFAKKKSKGPANPEAMSIPDAVQLLKAIEVTRPDNAIELHVKTQFKKGESAVLRGRLAMPRDPRTGEDKILVFCELDQVDNATAAGATWCGGAELVADVLEGKIVPTICLATPGMLPTIARLARTLGPKGLMPNVKRGTVNTNVVQAIQEAKGAFTWRGDKLGGVRAKVGRIHYPTEDIEKNVMAFLQNVRNGGGSRTASYDKGKTYEILKVHMSSTQGPGIELRDIRY
ncbi:ribosomal protein L1 [Calocera viscosa TUFC12733]|uniref:Ribosomal protein L1 n=1 Tax=Calocera viscosa (strain TUFC12733) TaxID=1330018 RepID=A0A167G6G3_CALVF|nr:ribosomal protein L1 [Calocera viscosa TUFC12733]